MLEGILVYIVAIASAPPILNLVSNVVAHRKNKKLMQGVRDEIAETKQFKELKNELKLAHQENRELKKQLNELLTKIDKVDRSNEESKNETM